MLYLSYAALQMYHVTLTDVIVCDTRGVDHVLLPSCFCPVYFSGETEWVEKYVVSGGPSRVVQTTLSDDRRGS